MSHKKYQLTIPADVPKKIEKTFIKNYETITKKTGHLFLFAADQKIEHLNDDFYGEGIASETADPEHLFSIASKGTIGAFATHPGLINRYGKKFPNIPYIAKLNGKTNIISTEQRDPVSSQLWSVHNLVATYKEHKINLCGVGYTLYLGSEYEHEMLKEAAQIIFDAHQHGLVTILWIYPRGIAVKDAHSMRMIAGAAGAAAALGTDFVKLNAPHNQPELLQIAAQAAGNTKIICSGGKKIEPESFLHNVHEQLHKGSTWGSATGRNIFQLPLNNAVALTNAIAALVYDNKTVADAYALYKK